jgi:hypothetical protein
LASTTVAISNPSAGGDYRIDSGVDAMAVGHDGDFEIVAWRRAVGDVAATWERNSDMVSAPQRQETTVTDQERQKAEELVGRLEMAVGQIFPRDGGNASLIATMIQTLNGLRSLLGIVRPH